MRSRKIFRAAVWALMLCGLFAGAITAGAWLKTSREAGFRLGADPTPDISIKKAGYSGGNYVWDQTWTPVEPNHTNKTLFGDPFDPGKYQNNTANLKAQCQFGEINNLNALDDSNYGWFCLRIHEDEGLHFQNLGVRYDPVPYDFFGARWENNKLQDIIPQSQFSGGKAKRLKAAIDAANQNNLENLMCMEGAWTSAREPQNGPQPYDLTKASRNYVLTSGSKSKGPFSGSAPMKDGSYQVDKDGYYYVYFCIYPNLASYHGMVNALAEFMPCYLSFKPMHVEIDVTTKNP